MKTRRSEPAVLPELESMLTVTAAAHVKASPRGDRSLSRALRARPSRIVAVGLVCLAFGGTAVAASDLWNPEVGVRIQPDSTTSPVTFSNSPVPAAVTDALGVLRREPNARDRSPEIEATLRGASFLHGVRLDSVRYLGPGVTGEDTLLLSAERAAEFRGETPEDGVCVVRPFAVGNEVPGLCFGLSDLLAGHARATWIDMASGTTVAFGVVPDGVATVTAKFGSAPDRTIPVANNYFELVLSGAEMSNANGEAGIQRTVWRDADGNVIPQAEQD